MSGGGSKAPSGYQPANQAGADQSYQAFINDLGTLQGQQSGVDTQLQQIATSVQNNPYYATAIQGANQVAGMAPGVAAGQQGAAQNLYGLAGMAQPMATQINQTAFDPQAALYNQQYQQNQDQSNAVNAMNGVAGSPFGAGLTQQSGQNFNLNWQNQQLGRQTAGAGAVAGLTGAAAGADTAGANLASQGLTTLAQGSALPSNTYLTQQNANIAALQALSGGYTTQAGIEGEGVSADQGYLGLGQSATANAQNATKINNAQSNAMWSGLLQAGGLAADIFAPGAGTALATGAQSIGNMG
jgi:hypothetical protein